MELKCVIVEDEVKAKDVLERYIDKVDYLSLAAYCQDGLEALKVIPKVNPDIMFLDINMPNLNGIELLEIVKDVPHVIITTAYSEYAIDSYDFDVTDYLLKPIPFSKFMRAINRVEQKLTRHQSPSSNPGHPAKTYTLFKSGSKTHKVYFDDILFLEKEGNYLEIVLANGIKVLIRANMSDVFDHIPASRFFRIHKSYVVNLEKIKTLEVHQLTLDGGKKVPIGLTYREGLAEKLKT